MNQETRRRISLYWGVQPRRCAVVSDVEDMAAHAEKRLLEERLVRRGDVVGIVAGTPFGIVLITLRSDILEALTMITGTLRVFGDDCSFASTLKPLRCGIIRSSRISAGG